MILKINDDSIIKIKIIIIIILILCIYKNCKKLSIINNSNTYLKFNNRAKTKFFHKKIKNVNDLIDNLNNYSNKTNKTNIIFHDYFISKTCFDKNSYILFQYFLKNNIHIPYYIINKNSDFYKYLRKNNNIKNLILFDSKKLSSFYRNLYKYLKDAKIIIASYTILFLQEISAKVPYIKFLKIDHGIRHFKIYIAKYEIISQLKNKTKIISSSPYEYEHLINELNYSSRQIYNASLIKYERFQYIKRNKNEKRCILISFTYRPYSKKKFEKSLYKMNLFTLLNDKELINDLYNRNINLIYVPHHEEINRGKKYSQKYFKYAIIGNQKSLDHYIEHCSLLITDFSSLSFDFMFQNKPVLFYPIDKNDKINYPGKANAIYPNNTLFFGNYFSDKNSLVNEIKYYTKNNFKIGYKLRNKYKSVFFIKTNIINSVVEIIKDIINNK